MPTVREVLRRSELHAMEMAFGGLDNLMQAVENEAQLSDDFRLAWGILRLIVSRADREDRDDGRGD